MITLTLTDDMEERLEALGAKNPESKARLAGEVLERALAELAALETRLKIEVEAAFASGPGREWGDEEWGALLRGEFRHEPEEDGLATPPGWRSPRLSRKNG